jgi:anti-anti-sigma factor
MILVTVGTEQYPFNALMSWVDLLIRNGLIDENEEVIVQYGSSSKLPDKVKIFKRLPESEFKDLLEQARLVISHCGEGSVMLLESLGKPYVLVPRTQRFGEHVDNHQLEMAIAMEKQGIPIARSPGDLVRFLAAEKASKVIFYNEHNEDELCQNLSNRYNCNKYKKIMIVCSSGGHFKYAQSLKPFLDRFQDTCWITFKTATTESQLTADKQRKYWAYSPTNRNLPNLIRNLLLAFNILNQERPDLVISTGAGIAVPFLVVAKVLYKKNTVFIESKTRLKKLSLSAEILRSLFVLDQLIVRTQELKTSYSRTEYIGNSAASIANKSDPETNIIKFKEIAFLRTPIHLVDGEVSQFKKDFQALCELAPQKIVLDLSLTVFLSSAGLGALVNSLKMANAMNIKLALWSVNSEVMSVFLQSKLNESFTIETSTLAVRPQNEGIPKQQLDVYSIVKDSAQRAIDMAVAVIGICITAILLIPIGIIIKLDRSGSVFCVQNRYGRMGKYFRMWTFRTRSTKAVVEDDLIPRITKVGQFLHKTKLDKLPLFWNVLVGDMSLVGPRASTADEVDCYSTEEWKVLRVKPGMISEWSLNHDQAEMSCPSTASLVR